MRLEDPIPVSNDGAMRSTGEPAPFAPDLPGGPPSGRAEAVIGARPPKPPGDDLLDPTAEQAVASFGPRRR